ncbi:hypothetical protein Hanom_Chr11g01005551 [Helianthus anomalus]
MGWGWGWGWRVFRFSGDETRSKNYFCGEDEGLMMDNFLIDMMGISF